MTEDIFPPIILSRSAKSCFRPYYDSIPDPEEIIPFIPVLDSADQLVTFHRKPWKEQFFKHFRRLSHGLYPNVHGQKNNWFFGEKRLQLPLDGKRNVDMRTSYRFHTNVFLVNKFFTFGLRSVALGQAHCFHIGRSPVFLYYIRYNSKNYPERFFDCSAETQFTQIILHPKKSYYLCAPLWYVLLTPGKAFFSMYFLSEENVSEPFENPISPETDSALEPLATSPDPSTCPSFDPNLGLANQTPGDTIPYNSPSGNVSAGGKRLPDTVEEMDSDRK